MSRVPQNLIANFLGKGVIAASGLVFIPLYMKFLTIDEFAIVALIPSFAALATMLDLGVTPSVSRELARLSTVPGPGSGATMRDLVRSFECISWILAIIIGVLGAILISPMIGRWAGVSGLSGETLRHAAYCLALNMALQWPTSLYSGSLVGLQRQAPLAIIFGVSALLRGGGVVLVLWLISPTVEAFLLWQALISLLLTAVLGVFLWRSLPRAPRRAKPDFGAVKSMWRMAAGMSGSSICSLLAIQMDKLILSQVLSLEMFGYYMLGYTIASKFVLVNAPIVEAVFPRMTQLAYAKHLGALRDIYRRTVQLAAVAFLPATAVFLFFGPDIMTVWTLNPELGARSGLLTAVLVCGFAASALMDITVVQGWSRGRTKVAFWTRFIGCLILFPTLIAGGAEAGALGGAVAWTAVEMGILLIGVPLIHKSWPTSYARSWYLQSLVPPITVSLVVAGLGSLVRFPEAGIPGQFAQVAFVTIAAYGAAALASPITRDIRARLSEHLERRRIGASGRG